MVFPGHIHLFSSHSSIIVLWIQSECSFKAVNILKFRPLVAFQQRLDKQGRPRSDYFGRSSLIRAFPVCYSDEHFVDYSLDNQYFIWEPIEIVFEILEKIPYTKISFNLVATLWSIFLWSYIYWGTLKTHNFTFSVASTWLIWGCFLYHFLSSCKMDHDLPLFRSAHVVHSDVIST